MFLILCNAATKKNTYQNVTSLNETYILVRKSERTYSASDDLFWAKLSWSESSSLVVPLGGLMIVFKNNIAYLTTNCDHSLTFPFKLERFTIE